MWLYQLLDGCIGLQNSQLSFELIKILIIKLNESFITGYKCHHLAIYKDTIVFQSSKEEVTFRLKKGN